MQALCQFLHSQFPTLPVFPHSRPLLLCLILNLTGVGCQSGEMFAWGKKAKEDIFMFFTGTDEWKGEFTAASPATLLFFLPLSKTSLKK